VGGEVFKTTDLGRRGQWEAQNELKVKVSKVEEKGTPMII